VVAKERIISSQDASRKKLEMRMIYMRMIIIYNKNLQPHPPAIASQCSSKKEQEKGKHCAVQDYFCPPLFVRLCAGTL
jgi:hypothetical protein